MKTILKYSSSLILLLGMVFSGECQDKRFLPTGFRFGTDVSLLGISAFSSNRSGYEINGDIDFEKYFFVFDIGHESRNRNSSFFSYNSEGDYVRVGIDANLLNPRKNPDNNVLFLGFRVCNAFFDDRVSFGVIDNNYGPISQFRRNFGLTANWLEIVTGLKVRLWKGLYLGYTGRLKFSKSLKGDEDLNPFDIPGFGKNSKESLFGINYYLMYRIQWREKPIPPEKQVK